MSQQQSVAAPTANRAGNIPCHDPATLEDLGTVAVMDDVAVRGVVQRGRAAQPSWAATSFAERRAVLEEVLSYIVSHQQEICRLCVRDSGKTMVDAALGEIFPVCEKLRYVIANGERDLAPEPRAPGFLKHKKAWVEYTPLGVIGVICPWNFPLQNVLAPAIPAIMAGNAALVKVSEWTSWSAARIQQIFDEALRAEGHSVDLVQLITGYGPTGAALVTSGVDKIVFTGSIGNGKRVLQASVDNLTPVILELGGKDPMIVCDDADLEQAVHNALVGTLTSAGQLCMAAERIYVFDAVHDQFVAMAARIVGQLRQGNPLGAIKVDVGAMTMPGQVDIVERLVNDAIERGARALVGGKRSTTGQFFEPTVLVDVDHSMAIMREETFGPVMAIMRVRDEHEAIALANDCAYGLSSSVFTRDHARGERIARQIVAGSTVINDFAMHYMAQDLPFGGVRGSGFGRLNGPEGLRGMCNTKAVVSDRLPFHNALKMYPVKPAAYDTARGVFKVLYSGTLAGRARGLVDIGRALLRRRKP